MLDSSIVSPRAFQAIYTWIECKVSNKLNSTSHLDKAQSWMFEVFTAADFLNMENTFMVDLLEYLQGFYTEENKNEALIVI